MIAEKSSGFTHNRGSLGFWVFVVVCAYFAFVSYWLIRGVIWSDKMISDYALCQALIKVPWRIIMFYSSELGAAVGVAFRSIAGCFAFIRRFSFGGVSRIAVIAVGIGLFVLCRKYVKWRITLAYLAATALFALGLNFVWWRSHFENGLSPLCWKFNFLGVLHGYRPCNYTSNIRGTRNIRCRLRHIVHSVSSILQLSRWLDRRVGHNEFDFTAVG